jgi:hypothetical protein
MDHFSKGTRSFVFTFLAIFATGNLLAQYPAPPPVFSGGVGIYVSPAGNDLNPGTITRPLATLAAAQKLARTCTSRGAVTVFLRGGTYYLAAPLVFTSSDSGKKNAPVTYQAFLQEKPVISGGVRLAGLNWQPYKNGIMQAIVPDDLQTDQLFVNGDRQVLARYPNYDPKITIFHGFAADAISPERVARWADPTGGFIHAMHGNMWGGYSYEITGKKPDGTLAYEGGWQNNRPGGMHSTYRYVENIFEELDAPKEWFLNTKTHVLYYYPPDGLNLKAALIEVARLKDLVEFQGTEQAPVKFVSLKGITFRHALRTFMETKEPLLRTDWTVYRGGAIFFNGAEDCSVEDSVVDHVGGNAIFVNDYNRRLTVRGCEIVGPGAGGVTFVGDFKAVRSPLFNYDKRQSYKTVDKTPGPLNNNYPAECLVDECLIHNTGQIEKQSAPVGIDISQDITVRHCSIYDCPRAGINIGDGCFGGQVIEFCDVFDTVKETGDHGSFNSWGRDRWWGLGDVDLNKIVLTDPELPRLDIVKPNILRNSRWRCDHGWDIDLDDGSSNYEITNNLCLHGGLKNREGFYRVVENNIVLNNFFYPQVWYDDSQDVFSHNIIGGPYNQAEMHGPPWGKEMDYNLIYRIGMTGTQPATDLQKQSGRDQHSLIGDPLFTDPSHGDYSVKAGSPALALGFKNFPMDQFGVQKPSLKAIARTPLLPGSDVSQTARRDATPKDWAGAQVRNIADQGEMSVYGLPGVTGVLVVKIDPVSNLTKAGLQADDVILGFNDDPISQLSDLLKEDAASGAFKLKISRNQEIQVLSVTP